MFRRTPLQTISFVFFVVLALVAPLVVTDQYTRHFMVMSGIWIIASLGLNLILGYSGQLNLAHGSFFGIGAYATALLIQKAGLGFWAALPLSCLITASIGFLCGLPTLRTRGHYFPIATMCLGIAIYYVIGRWDDFTGGPRGLFGIPRPDPIPLPFFGQVTFESTLACYYLVLLFAVVTFVLIAALMRSLAGWRLIAIRGNEDLAQSLGIDTMRGKVICFTLSTLFAGLAGSLYCAYMGTLMAEQAHYLLSFEMLLYVMIGGVGSMAGPVLGGILVPYVNEALQSLAGLRLIIFGALLILVVRFFPFGLVGGFKLAFARLGWMKPKKEYRNEYNAA